MSHNKINKIGLWGVESGKRLLLNKTDKGVEFIFEDLSSKEPNKIVTIESFRLIDMMKFLRDN